MCVCVCVVCIQYFQLLLGDTMTVSQPTISRIVFRVSLLVASLLKEYIKMPRDQETRNENRRLFNDLGNGNGAIGLPGVDGARLYTCEISRYKISKYK